MNLTKSAHEETIATAVPEALHSRLAVDSVLYSRALGSGGIRAQNLMSAGDIATGTGIPIRSGVEAQPKQVVPRSVHNAIALAFRSCDDALERAASSGDDEVAHANSISQLKDSLDRLWQQRNYRERQYAGIINMFQLLLAAEGQRLSTDQLRGMKACLSQVTRYPRVSGSDYRAALERLQRAGLDISNALR